MSEEKTACLFQDRVLPPCRVCGEPGTGLHYGVNTCGACKGFFRRSLSRHEPYECSRSSFCRVGPGTSRRQSCPKCRLEKCLFVGMSKEAIKIGRYTLVKRSKDFEEVMHRLEPYQPPGRNSVPNSNESQTSSMPSSFQNLPNQNTFHHSTLNIEERKDSSYTSADYMRVSNQRSHDMYPRQMSSQIDSPHNHDSNIPYIWWCKERHITEKAQRAIQDETIADETMKEKMLSNRNLTLREESDECIVRSPTYTVLEPSTSQRGLSVRNDPNTIPAYNRSSREDIDNIISSTRSTIVANNTINHMQWSSHTMHDPSAVRHGCYICDQSMDKEQISLRHANNDDNSEMSQQNSTQHGNVLATKNIESSHLVSVQSSSHDTAASNAFRPYYDTAITQHAIEPIKTPIDLSINSKRSDNHSKIDKDYTSRTKDEELVRCKTSLCPVSDSAYTVLT